MEEIRLIKDFPGYIISSYGNVRNKKGLIMKPQLYNNGSKSNPFVSMYVKKGMTRKRRIAWLVAEAFIPNPNNYKFVAHLDGDILNNHVDNLTWCRECQGDWPIGFHKFVEENIKGKLTSELATLLNEKFGLNLTSKDVHNYVTSRKLSSGVNTQFKPGRIPTTGMIKKGEHRSIKTEFKLGSKPYNTVPIGTETVKSDGYVYVKIRDIPHKDYRTNWKKKHYILWEKENGPIPHDKVLLFLNGDKTDVRIGNLTLISKADLMVMCRNNLIKSDPALTITGLNIARLMINCARREKEKKENEK